VRRGRGLQPDRLAQLYARFEERFRGSPEDIRQRVGVYAQRVARVIGPFSGLPFLDLGCGRGELVAALRDAGIPAEGIEANPTFAEVCRNAGIPVHQSDLFEELRRRPDGSLAGISAIQVVEHLQAEALVEFLELARAKIAASGLLVLETIDVRSLYALRWFFADPTHVLPLMPETLGFYVENAGFTELEVVPLHPVLEPVAPPPGGGKRIERVTEVVFGPQDFALIARRPPVRRLAAVATPNAPTAPKPRVRRRTGRRRSAARGKARSGGKTRVRTAVRHDTRRKKS
jgi:O-antigen chain-terminating methyltransferase